MPTVDEFLKQYGNGSGQSQRTETQQPVAQPGNGDGGRSVDAFMAQYGSGSQKQQTAPNGGGLELVSVSPGYPGYSAPQTEPSADAMGAMRVKSSFLPGGQDFIDNLRNAPGGEIRNLAHGVGETAKYGKTAVDVLAQYGISDKSAVDEAIWAQRAEDYSNAAGEAFKHLGGIEWEDLEKDELHRKNIERQIQEIDRELDRVGPSSPVYAQMKAYRDKLAVMQGVYSDREKVKSSYVNKAEYDNGRKTQQYLEESWEKAQKAGMSREEWAYSLQAGADDLELRQKEAKEHLQIVQGQMERLERIMYMGYTPEALAMFTHEDGTPYTRREVDALYATLKREEADYQKAADEAENEMERAKQIAKAAAAYAHQARYSDLPEREDWQSGVEAGKAAYLPYRQAYEQERANRANEVRTGNVEVAGLSDDELAGEDKLTYRTPYGEWSEDELNTYYYLFNQDREKAANYALEVNRNHLLTQRYDAMKRQQDWAHDNAYTGGALVGTGSKVLTSPAAFWDWLGSGVQYLNTGTVMPRADLSPRDYANAWSGGAAARMNEDVGTLPEDWWVIGGKGLGDAYQFGNSVLESLAWRKLSKAIAAAGGPEWLGGVLTNVGFFGNAADQTTQDALARGASSEQAMVIGIWAGAAEALGETVSIEHLIHMDDPTAAKKLIWNVLKQSGIEASEEALTTIVNTYGEMLVMGDKSEINTKIDAYVKQGMSRKEAEKRAWREWNEDLIFDALGGALSGGTSALATGGLSFAKYKHAEAQTRQEQALLDSLTAASQTDEANGNDNATLERLKSISQSSEESKAFKRLYGVDVETVLTEFEGSAETGQTETQNTESAAEAPEQAAPAQTTPARETGIPGMVDRRQTTPAAQEQTQKPEAPAQTAERQTAPAGSAQSDFRSEIQNTETKIRDDLEMLDYYNKRAQEAETRGDRRGAEVARENAANVQRELDWARDYLARLRTYTDANGINTAETAQGPQEAAGEPVAQGGTETAEQGAETPTAQAPLLNSNEGATAETQEAAEKQTAEQPPELNQGESAEQNHKKAQFQLIQQNHPNTSSTEYTWIDSVDDIKTFDEAFAGQQGNVTPDFTAEMIDEARRTGKITVYSSHRFLTRPGTFVTPSKMLAQDYAGGGKVYAKTVDVNDIAWIDEEQGQYAKVAPVQQQPGQDSAQERAGQAAAPTAQTQESGTPRASSPTVQTQTPAQTNTPTAQTESTASEAQEERDRRYLELGEQYGTIEAGEIPSRESSVPKKSGENEVVSKTARTLYEAAATPDRLLPTIQAAVVNGDLSHIPVENKTLANNAATMLRMKGFDTALRDWTADVRAGKRSDELTAMGAVLYNNAANSNIDGKALVDLIMDYTYLTSGTGSALNAAKILKRLSPEGKIYSVQKAVNEINSARNVDAARRAKKSAKKAQKTARKSATETETAKGTTNTAEETESKAAEETENRKVTEEDNVPVSEWADKAGESVADSLADKLRAQAEGKVTEKKLKTMCQIAEEDVKKILKSYGTKGQNLDARALENILTNPAFYNTLYNSLRSSLQTKANMSAEEIAELGHEWIDKPLADILAQMAAQQSDIHVNEGLVKAYLDVSNLTKEDGTPLSAEQQDAMRDEIMDAILKDIARQVPSTIGEKIRAIRYLNMLGNLKTQGRNVIGNTASTAMRIAKDTVKGTLELGLHAVTGGRYERTTSLWVPPSLMSECLKDFQNVKDIAMGEAKYSDGRASNVRREIEENKRVFKPSGTWGTDPVSSSKAARAIRKAVDAAEWLPEGYRLATKWAMEFGDLIFSGENYAASLARYLYAHKVSSIEDASPELLDKARAYAVRQAQETTFRDSNAVSTWVSGLGRNAPLLVRGAISGALPFRKTPANVLVRAYEYSPLGVLTSFKYAYDVIRQNGKATGQDLVDMLSKNLTGTGLFLLGMLLHRRGWLRTKDDDDKLEQFHKDQGAQDWSLSLKDGSSYTLDWLAPASMPLFMGAVYDQLDADEDISGNDALRLIASLSEPMMEMSMLSGLNDSIEAATARNAPLPPILQFGLNSLLNMASQTGVNSLYRQYEQAQEENRSTYWTDPDSKLPEIVQKALAQSSVGLPGPGYQRMDYVDAWGRKQDKGSTGERYLQAFVSPWYKGKDRSTPYDAELERLYKDGYTNAIPQAPSRKDTWKTEDGASITIGKEDYEKYAIEVGQNKLELVGEFMDSEEYKKLDDETRAAIINNLYEYAVWQARRNYTEDHGASMPTNSKWESVESVEKAGVDPAAYLLGKKQADTDGSGQLAGQEIYDWLMGSDYNERQRRAIWDATKGTSTKTWEEYRDTNPVTYLMNAGLSQKDAQKMIGRIDTDGERGISQRELYQYYLAHPDEEALIREYWDNQRGFSTSWDSAKRKPQKSWTD